MPYALYAVLEKRVAFEKAPQNFCLEKILKDAKNRIPVGAV
jgi:hypothetical protein